MELLPDDQQLGVERCTLYSSLPGPLQSVERAEMWSVVLALQAAHAVHLRVDNLNVVRHVSRMLAGWSGARPFELCVGGDLLPLIADLIQKRCSDTVLISKIKGHADDEMVRTGRVRAMDKFGNDSTDIAADFGRRRLPAEGINARKSFLAACDVWYPLIFDLHRYFIAIARKAVNEDGHGGIKLFGIWGGNQKGDGSCGLSENLLGSLDLSAFGDMAQLVGLLSMLVMLTLLPGPIRLACWVSCGPFLVACTGILLLMTWRSLTSRFSSWLFSMSVGLVSGWFWSLLFLELGGLDA